WRGPALAVEPLSHIRIPPQPIVRLDLFLFEDISRGQVRPKVGVPKLTMEPRDLACGGRQVLLIQMTAPESQVKVAFRVDDGRPEFDRPFAHSGLNLKNVAPLLVRKLDRIGELERMQRARIMVELGGLGEAHTRPAAKILKLL
ncbi:MAG: hypothetical protein KJO06_07700, partial [Gemmatimonadetes bacterium]|nr:hypothetical protein [Gemmatimonadota bacterium]